MLTSMAAPGSAPSPQARTDLLLLAVAAMVPAAVAAARIGDVAPGARDAALPRVLIARGPPRSWRRASTRRSRNLLGQALLLGTREAPRAAAGGAVVAGAAGVLVAVDGASACSPRAVRPRGGSGASWPPCRSRFSPSRRRRGRRSAACRAAPRRGGGCSSSCRSPFSRGGRRRRPRVAAARPTRGPARSKGPYSLSGSGLGTPSPRWGWQRC